MPKTTKTMRITAWLCSPICGSPPRLDAMLEYELARRMGVGGHVTRATPAGRIAPVPIPLARETVGGYSIPCCSDPIMPRPAASWIEHVARRFNTSRYPLLLRDKQRKNLLVASGPYKQLFRAKRITLVDRVIWFCRGRRREINKLLKGVPSIGSLRGMGYGLVRFFDIEEVDDDYSIMADGVLMRTVPAEVAAELGATGYTVRVGGWKPPYWHPDTQTEVAVPC